MIEKGDQHEEVQHFKLVLEKLSSEISNPKNNILEFITLFTSNDSKRLEGLKESNQENLSLLCCMPLRNVLKHKLMRVKN